MTKGEKAYLKGIIDKIEAYDKENNPWSMITATSDLVNAVKKMVEEPLIKNKSNLQNNLR